MTDQTRQPKGIPVGGQFATHSRDEAGVELAPQQKLVAVSIRWSTHELPSPRHRVMRLVEHSDLAEIAVTTLSAEDAPVAFSVPAEGRDDGFDVREHDGALYRAVEPATEGGYERVLRSMLVRSIGGMSSREEAVEAVEDNARRIAIIDGHLWEHTSAPGYVVRTYGLGFNHGGTGLHYAFADTHMAAEEDFFRADEYDDAVAAAVEVAEERGDDKSIPRLRSVEPIAVSAATAATLGPTTNRTKMPSPFDHSVSMPELKRMFVDQLKTIPGAITETVEAGQRVRRVDYSKLTDRQAAQVRQMLERAAVEGVL